MHDNEDGTLSERHVGLLRRIGGQASAPKPAIVVSRGPPDPSDPPAVEPSYPPSGPRESAGYVQNVGTGGILESGLNADTPTSSTADGQGSKREGGGALWSYLQPHLVKHKGPNIPRSGWVPQLITLPKVRDIDWNTAWLTTHPFNDTNPRDISALIIQVTGELAPEPCERCRNNIGPFRSCIMISSKADSGPLRSVFACANCFYHFGQSKCSHKQWGAERASRILDREVTVDPPIEPLEEMAEDEELSDDSSGEDEGDTNALYDENMEYAMDGSNAEPVLTLGGAPTGIDEAEPGRLYSMWPGKISPSCFESFDTPDLTTMCQEMMESSSHYMAPYSQLGTSLTQQFLGGHGFVQCGHAGKLFARGPISAFIFRYNDRFPSLWCPVCLADDNYALACPLCRLPQR